MRITKAIILLGGVIGLTLSSCQKEADILEHRKSQITFGNSNGMIVTSFDTLIKGSYQQSVLDMDVNNDGQNDIRISAQVLGSMGVGYTPQSKIECFRNDIEFLGTVSNDTLFLKREMNVVLGTNPVEIYEKKYVSCIRLDSLFKPRTISLDIFKLLSNDSGTTFSKADVFQSDSLFLSQESVQRRYSGSGYYPDTTVLQGFYTNLNNCFNAFPRGKNQYIGFKFIQNNTERLGWVKIRLDWDHEIDIIEWAIQE